MVQLYGFNLNFLVIKFMYIFFDLCFRLVDTFFVEFIIFIAAEIALQLHIYLV